MEGSSKGGERFGAVKTEVKPGGVGHCGKNSGGEK